MDAGTQARSAGTELGRLAELAARATGPADRLEARITEAVRGLIAEPGLARLAAVAGDAARPLPRRAAVLAALHQALYDPVAPR